MNSLIIDYLTYINYGLMLFNTRGMCNFMFINQLESHSSKRELRHVYTVQYLPLCM